MSSAKKEKKPQLNGLCTGDWPRGMAEWKSHCPADMVFTFVASFSDRIDGFEVSRHST